MGPTFQKQASPLQSIYVGDGGIVELSFKWSQGGFTHHTVFSLPRKTDPEMSSFIGKWGVGGTGISPVCLRGGPWHEKLLRCPLSPPRWQESPEPLLTGGGTAAVLHCRGHVESAPKRLHSRGQGWPREQEWGVTCRSKCFA